MNPAVSCRQLSPRLGLALLLVLTVLAAPTASAGKVGSISVTTDQTDYVNVPGFNIVTATALVNYVGNNQIDNVKFDWFDPGAPLPFRIRWITPSAVSQVGRAQDVWTADREGINFRVMASINETVDSPPVWAQATTFNVHNRTVFVTVRDLVVTTNPVYENGTVATARATLTWSGNGSLLGPIRFDWFYPGWVPAFTETVASAPSGTASSSWTIDREGPGFRVNATYLGGNLVTNTTGFDVISTLVNQTLTGDFTTPGNVILPASGGPYGICSNTSVATGVNLIIQAGTIIRFCPDTGLFVNGTLTVDALWNRRVYFLPWVLPPMRRGDWRGITFFSGAPTNSLLSNAVIQAVTEAVTVQGTAITIVNSVFALASGPAIQLTNSATLVGNNSISDADVGVRIDATNGAAIDANRIEGTRIGVLAVDSDVTLASNNISRNLVAGLQALRTTVSVQGGSFRDGGNAGVDLSDVPSARLARVTIAGGNDSLRAINSRDVVVDASTLAGSWFRSIFFLNVSATLVNTTMASIGRDLQVLSSTVTTINSTFARLESVNSVTTVRYFLHVLVESSVPTMPRFQGAWVNVTSGGTALPPRRTDAAGWALWILLTDRVVSPVGTLPYANVVTVGADGFSVAQNPRTVNMSASHVERFTAVPLGPIVNPPFSVDPMLLLAIAVVLGAVLLVMPVIRRRRREEHPGARRGSLPHETVLEPGTAYLVPDEKPDRAFEILASQVAKGSKGLVITRIYPEEVRRRFRLKDVPVLWLSRGYGKDTVNPTNLGALVHEIERYVSGKEDSVVLLDGLEYLLVQNDTQKVVKFVQTLADSASVHHTKVLLPFNEKSIGEAERALLTRDLQIL